MCYNTSDAVSGLVSQEHERFLALIAKAVRARGDHEALAIAADEALALDNEALGIAERQESSAVQVFHNETA